MIWLKLKKASVDAIISEMYKEGLTPSIVVYTDHPKFIGPTDLSDDKGCTVFSLGLKSVRKYTVDTECISFEATFNGEGVFIDVPYESIVAVTSTGGSADGQSHGLVFPFEVRTLEETVGETSTRNPHANLDWAKSAVVVQ